MNTAMIRPQWGPLTIAMMVLGFILWWPLGLAMLAYIIWGEAFGGSADKAERFVHRSRAWAETCGRQAHGFRRGFGAASGNAAFDDYRAEQLKRLDEERRRLDEEIHEFHEYMRTLRMARDREEFDRFMRERKGGRSTYESSGNEGPRV
jgi:hypothetical protein